MSRIAVVGAGIGGLCTAIRLAHQGHSVSIYERNPKVGGKLWTVSEGGYRFSYGPSTLTMPEVYRDLLNVAGLPVTMLNYKRLEVNHRNVFADGSLLDCVADTARMQEHVARLSDSDSRRWPRYVAEVERLAAIAKAAFFSRGFTHIGEYLSPELVSAFLRVHPLQSMQSFHSRFASDARLQMTLDRYATYVGSDPRRTPATLAMIGGLEFGDGVYTLAGGADQLITVLEDAARRVGVQIHVSCPVHALRVVRGSVQAVEVNGDPVAVDKVVYNGDRGALPYLLSPSGNAHEFVPEVMGTDSRLSHSGFVLLLGVRRQFSHLQHHTVFFPPRYMDEFDSLFIHKELPLQPTIYVCNSSVTDPALAPTGGSNLFVLVNVPSRLLASDVWDRYEEHILELLEKRCGLVGLRAALEFKQRVTPNDLALRTGALNGAIYGMASHGIAAFRRPSLQSRRIENLYFVGGTNHPGGGTPMVAIGAKLVADLIGSA